jgi:hypothetical protein
MKYEGAMDAVIDKWDVSNISLELGEMFDMLRACVSSYIQGEQHLDFKIIIRIVKDLREALGMEQEPNTYYFTDIVCDQTLVKYEGIGEKQIPELFTFIGELEAQTQLKH